MIKQVYSFLFGMGLLVGFIYSVTSPTPIEGLDDKTEHLHGNDSLERTARASPTQFQQEMLNAHNSRRKRHCVSPLELDDQLNKEAQSYADTLAQTDILVHSKQRGGAGENLFMSWGPPFNGNGPTKAWYSEVKHYNFETGAFTKKTGHVTQVLWKNSQRLGVGIATSKSKKTYVVARYKPGGNYAGQFQKNVLPATC